MAVGRFYRECCDEKIRVIAEHMLGENIIRIQQVCEQWGEGIDDVRYYEVYRISTQCGDRLLKQSEEREAYNYESFLCRAYFHVPKYFGCYREQDKVWILMEHVEGTDLRNMSDEMAMLAADSIAQIQNYFWDEPSCDDRFDIYWRRILKRAMFVADNPILRNAYQKFLERQLECPRTFSNGDFLPFNAIQTEKQVMIIDWGFGGIMPYSLDLARFVAHATETRATFPFYMSLRQKELFLKRVYEKLENKPGWERYVRDIKLAVLNEYIEFVEAGEDENEWYKRHALQLAEEILED